MTVRIQLFRVSALNPWGVRVRLKLAISTDGTSRMDV